MMLKGAAAWTLLGREIFGSPLSPDSYRERGGGAAGRFADGEIEPQTC